MSVCNIKGLALAAAITLAPSAAFAGYNPYLSPGTPVVVLSGVDNGPAINAAIALVAAGQSPAPVIVPSLPGGANPNFSTPIANPGVVPVIVNGCMNFTGSGADAWVEGALDGAPHIPVYPGPSSLCVNRATLNLSDQFAGIALDNVYSDVNLTVSASNFWVCLDQKADYASYYNTIFIGTLKNCQIHQRLFAVGLTGTVNQNTYIGGRWTSNILGSSANLEAIRLETGQSPLDGNVWINPDFEMIKETSGQSGNITIFSGVLDGAATSAALENRMFGGRMESVVSVGGGSLCVLGGDGLYDNTLQWAFGMPASGATSNTATVWLCPVNTTGAELNLIANGITGAGDVGQGTPGLITYGVVNRKDVVLRNKSGTTNMERSGEDLFWVSANSGTCDATHCVFATEQPFNALTTDTIQNTAGRNSYGRVFDLRGNNTDFNRLIMVTANSSTAGGRIVVVPFDASGNLLTNASSPLPCCGHISATGFSYSSGEKVWNKANDLPAGIYSIPVSLDPSVAFVFIGIEGGSAVSHLRTMTISVNPQSQIVPLQDNGVIGVLSGMPCLDFCSILPEGPTTVDIPQPAASGNTYQTGETAQNVFPQNGNVAPSFWIYQSAVAAASATMTCATPSVVSLTNKFKVNQPVVLGGTPCTGFTAGTTYYVISAGLTTSAFELSATVGGAAINGTGSSSGLTVSTAWSPGPNVP